MADMNNMHTLNTRIKLKYDSYQNWYDKNPTLLEGEVAVATIANNETNKTNSGLHNLPNVAVKVGDGTHPYRELPFITALAGDVHDWAKKDLEEFHTDEAEWIKGNTDLNEWVTNLVGETIEDTNTKYKLTYDAAAPYTIKLMATDGKPGSTEYNVEAAVIDLSEIDDRLKVVEEALGEGGSVDERIQDAVDGMTLAEPLTTGVGKVIDTVTQTKGVVGITTRDLQIADVSGLSDEIAGMKEDIGELETNKQDKLDIDGTPSADNKVATMSSITSAIGDLDYTDEAVEHQFIVAVSEEDGILKDIVRRAVKVEDVEGLETALAGKQEKLVIDGVVSAENPVATKETVTKAVAGLEGAMHFRAILEGETLEAALAASGLEDWANGDVVIWGEYEYVWDGSEWAELGNTNLYQLKADAEDQHKEITDAMAELAEAKQDVVPFENTPSESDKVATVKSIEDRIVEHTKNINYDGGEFGEHKFVTKVTETEGALEVAYAQPAVADINGLQGEIDRIDKAISDMDDAKQDVLPIDGTPAEDNKVATQSTVQGAVDALNYTDEAVEGQFITAISEEKGILKNVTRGNITTDHIQQGALTFVLDCGGAEF